MKMFTPPPSQVSMTDPGAVLSAVVSPDYQHLLLSTSTGVIAAVVLSIPEQMPLEASLLGGCGYDSIAQAALLLNIT